MSFWKIPNEIPSVSLHIARYPMPGMVILLGSTLPPAAEILLENSSMEDTLIVFVTLLIGLGSCPLSIGVSPPSMPGQPLSSPVFVLTAQ